MELNLDQFSPKQAELITLAAEAKAVSITDFLDKEQYQLANETYQKLKKTRVILSKAGKALRDDAVKFSRAVIEREKELINIIAPEEDRLGEELEQADNARARERRKSQLQMRRIKLQEIGASADDDALLDMDDDAFNTFYAGCLDLFRAEEQRRLDAIAEEQRLKQEEQQREAARLADEKRQAEEAKQLAEKARERAQAELAAEKERVAAEEERAKERIAAEEQRLAEQQAAFEQEQAAAKRRAEAEAADAKLRAEQAEAEKKRLEAEAAKKEAENTKLQAFLTKHGATKDTIASGDYLLRKTDSGYALYKRIDQLAIE